jgi:outer membrane protein assembly factor BamB
MKGEVLVFTAKGRLVSLDPLTGEQRWQEENFPSASRVSFLPANRRVLVFAPGDSVVDFSLETRKRRTLRGLPAFNGGHASLEAYGAHLGVVRKDGAFVLIDAATLEPAWQYTPTQHPIRAAARKERKLALVDAAGGLLLFDLPRGF